MTSLFDFSDAAFLATFWSIIPSIALAALIYFRGHNTWREKIFVLSSLVFVLWAFINYLSLQPDLGTLFLARLVLLFAILLQLMFLLLIYTFSGNFAHAQKSLFILLGTLSAVTMIATQTSLVFTDIVLLDGQIIPMAGPEACVSYAKYGRERGPNECNLSILL